METSVGELNGSCVTNSSASAGHLGRSLALNAPPSGGDSMAFATFSAVDLLTAVAWHYIACDRLTTISVVAQRRFGPDSPLSDRARCTVRTSHEWLRSTRLLATSPRSLICIHALTATGSGA
jgi:hypothetical protein